MLTDCQAWTGAVILQRQSDGTLHAGLGRDHKHGGSDGSGRRVPGQNYPSVFRVTPSLEAPLFSHATLWCSCVSWRALACCPTAGGLAKQDSKTPDKGRRWCICAPNHSKKMQYSLKMPLKIPPTEHPKGRVKSATPRGKDAAPPD